MKLFLSAFVLIACSVPTFAAAESATITVPANAAGKPISADLFGVFFEDINYAADGGLYAELVQNRSFEYQMTEQPTWNNLTSWELQPRGGSGRVVIGYAAPLHANNPHYAVLELEKSGDVALVNTGFEGIAVEAGATYELSFFAQQVYFGKRWGSENDRGPLPLAVRLEAADGTVLGEAKFEVTERAWRRFSATLTASQTDAHARLVVIARERGGITLDEISLFPQKTFRGRANGLRADLAQTIADLHPRFVRFPGGCLAHGNGLPNLYRWKDTIGPVEQRRQQPNIWGYHQTVGLGYFEYFQFCEDIGAKPLPVVAAGVSCQNSGHTGGTGQQCIPMSDMPAYVQEVLDLIEWANGPATSTWGAKRAAAGHPEPFRLEYLGVGNEDHITPEFEERFRMIHDAVKAKHPEITVIGTVGPFHSGEDFEAGWKIARERRLAMVDEHYYEKPEWFLANLDRYDRYDRTQSKIYLGEYASRGNTLANALAEAAYMTALERNGDVVHLASYAPLLAKVGHTQWNPDLIYFTNTAVRPSVNYYVQQLFSTNAGDAYLAPLVSGPTPSLAVSAVRNTRAGDVILKIVNTGSMPQPLRIRLAGAKSFATHATRTVLAGDPKTVNNFDNPAPLVPATTTIAIDEMFDAEAPAHSFTVIRISERH